MSIESQKAASTVQGIDGNNALLVLWQQYFLWLYRPMAVLYFNFLVRDQLHSFHFALFPSLFGTVSYLSNCMRLGPNFLMASLSTSLDVSLCCLMHTCQNQDTKQLLNSDWSSTCNKLIKHLTISFQIHHAHILYDAFKTGLVTSWFAQGVCDNSLICWSKTWCLEK